MATMKAWVERHRKRYRVRYRDRSGRSHDIEPVSLFAGKADANAAKDLWEENQIRNATGHVDLDYLLRDACERWFRDCRSGQANRRGKIIKESTIQCFRDSLKYIIQKYRTIGELTKEEMSVYISMLYEMYDGWTPYRRLTDLKSFCGYMRRKKIMSWDPFEDFVLAKPESRPRFYTDDEVNRLEASAVAIGLEAVLFLRLGYMSGLRIGEAMRILIEDVQPDPDPDMAGYGRITVYEDEAKTRSSRVTIAPPELMEILVHLTAGRSYGRVFKDRGEASFLCLWAKILCGAGLPPAPWYRKHYQWAKDAPQDDRQAPYHGLRHTFCRRSIENGMDLSILKEFTGHKSVEILMKTYAHFGKKHLRLRAKEVHENIRSRQESVGHMWGKLAEILTPTGSEGLRTTPLVGSAE